MLPTTSTCEDSMWQSDFLRTSVGLRGVLILWVFAAHASHAAALNQQYVITLETFNTAAFIILTGFSTYISTRNKPLHYGKWVMGRWFGLIPIYLLMLLTVYLPQIYQAATSQKEAVSTGTKIYLLIMNFLGLSLIGDSGNFSFLHNFTAFDTSADLGDVGIPLANALSTNYFSSLLFCQLLLFALFHFTLSFRLPRRVFQAGHGLVAGIGAASLIAASLAIGFLAAPISKADWWQFSSDASFAVTYQNINPGNSLWMVPCLMFGVCVAEVRFHLGRRVRAVLGHWLVVDLTIAAFVVFTALPHYHKASFDSGIRIWYRAKCASPDLTAQQKTFCDVWLSRSGVAVSATAIWTGVAVSATQFVLFTLMLLSLSCQVYHKKRSLAVFGLVQTRFCRFFGQHSYTLYVVQIVVIFGPWMKWFVCFGAAAGTCTAPNMETGAASSNFLHSWMYKAYLLVVTVVFGMLVQRWQDTFVSATHVAVMQFLQPGIGVQCWKVLTDEQNPLSGLVLACQPAARAEAGAAAQEAAALPVVVNARRG